MTIKSVPNSPTASALAVIDLANEMLAAECIDHNFLRELGSDFNRLYHAWHKQQAIEEERLPASYLAKLWLAAERFSPDSEIGLKIGSKVNHDAKGLLANWVFQCESLAESFDTFSQNIHLLNPSEQWVRSDGEDGVKLTLKFQSDDYPDIAVDRSMATIVSWSSAISGHKTIPMKAHFVRERPECCKRYHDVFGESLSFSQQENALYFSKEMFYQTNEMSNSYLKGLLKKQASDLNATLKRSQTLKGQVDSLLKQDLARFCQIDLTCRALHLSRSTLYRKLKAEDTSFTDRVKQARMEKAMQLETRETDQGSIAEQLGFRDTSSYYRFRKTNSI